MERITNSFPAGGADGDDAPRPAATMPAMRDRSRQGLRPGGAAGRAAAARRRPAPRRHPDREPARHHAAGAGNPRRGRRDRLRGHPGDAQAARPLRHRDAAHALPRAQRRSRAAEAPGAARRGRGHRAGFGRRHAADFRPRLQAGARGARGRPCGHRGARRIRGAGGARRRRAADRPVLLRGLPAARRTASAGPASPSSRAFPATLILYESGPRMARTLAALADGLGAAAGRGLPRTHQAARGGSARRPRGAGARL